MQSDPNNPKHINIDPNSRFVSAKVREIKPIYFTKSSLDFVFDCLSRYDFTPELDKDAIWDNTDENVIFYL